MSRKFNCWKTCGPFLRGRLRLILSSAKDADRCQSFTETKGLLHSYFYAVCCDEGLARQLCGSKCVDGLYAREAQKTANSMGQSWSHGL